MKKGVNVSNLTHLEWLEMRQSGIGGSDAAAVVGMNPWKSAAQVYLSKTESVEDDTEVMSERLRVGHDLEDYVAKRFAEATGKKVRRNNYMLHHDDYPFILADIDREVVGENAILECKTTNSYAAKDWETEPPEQYQVQCLHYMLVTGAERCYIAVLIGNERFAWYTIERDEEAIAALLEAEVDFWRNYVEAGICPPPDGSNAYDDYLKKRYPHDDGEEMQLMNEGESALSDYLRLQDMAKDIEEQMRLYRQIIENEMGETQVATSRQGHKVTWKTQTRTTLDSKRLKKELPGVYDTFAKTSESRVFRVSAAKAE